MTKEQQINDRQREILQYVVCNFILTAAPVASRYVASHSNLGLSPATIRNTMADLEEMGYVTHPHTSAGRMPTDKGYRFFVDWLMEIEPLTTLEKQNIRRQLDGVREPAELLHQAAKLLGEISHQLSIVSSPQLRSSVLEHMELISISTNRILVVLSVRSGIVRTITVEVVSEYSQENLNRIAHLLNERLYGLTLQAIRDTVADRMKDVKDEGTGLIDIFIRSANRIFDDSKEWEKLHIAGTHSLVEQPEYENPDNFRTIIDLLNDEGELIEFLERPEPKREEENVAISIGQEHREKKLKNYSVVVSQYRIGDVAGKIGIIGPKRMPYAKVVPVVNYIAEEVSLMLS